MTELLQDKDPGPKPSPETGNDNNNPPPPPPPPKPGRGVEINTKEIRQQINNVSNYLSEAPLPPLSDLLEDLSDQLPRQFHPFQAPDHNDILEQLETAHIILLKSYNEDAAYAAGHKLATDKTFSKGKTKKRLFPAAGREKERSDLELMRLKEKDFLRTDQILLIELNEKCTFLDSVLAAGHGALVAVYNELERNSSYIILSVAESLVKGPEKEEKLRGFCSYTVSHLRYLLTPHYGDEAAAMEVRVITAMGGPLAAEHYQLIFHYLSRGRAEFEKFLEERRAVMVLAPELRATQLPTVEPSIIFRDDSQVHRAAAFVAACFPELNQRDFDRMVRLLLGDESTTKETVRHAFRPDGKLVTVREKTDEPCTKCWDRDADKIFHECHLRTVVLQDGSWVVDFCEPHLRGELRSYLDEHHPWYLKRQCELLQTSGVLFFDELSPKTIEGLVNLFVERTIVDPTGFGGSWLADLVFAGRTALRGTAAPGSLKEFLSWLAKEQLRERFQERLVILIREMLDHDVLRPAVRQFFDKLMESGQHQAMLDLLLDLAPRLRFVPGFDPLIWMKRLLNEGRAEVQERTFSRLLELARLSGARIYEFLNTIHDWLPDSNRRLADYSTFNVIAIQFPFAYCGEMAEWIIPGVWPSQHPLFYALPDDPIESKEKVVWLIEWIIDARGAAFAEADASDPLKSAEAARIGLVADLVEHWSWVLEGLPSQTPPSEGSALFGVILEVLDSKLSPSQRTWLQRQWQRRQEELLNEAGKKSGQERKNLVAHKTKLEQLRMRYADLASTRRIPIQREAAL